MQSGAASAGLKAILKSIRWMARRGNHSDHIICDDCEIKAHPEIYFDHQCKDCGKWWNKRDGHTFELGSDGVWMCYTCARALAAKIMAEPNPRPNSDG